mmetsp:Transcript_4348/g.9750  ORF Transcript_4348/g.9750 Transcript_4348/m.9750 type:complete len:301 (-) Transcript_4348:2535-3437(-)
MRSTNTLPNLSAAATVAWSSTHMAVINLVAESSANTLSVFSFLRYLTTVSDSIRSPTNMWSPDTCSRTTAACRPLCSHFFSNLRLPISYMRRERPTPTSRRPWNSARHMGMSSTSVRCSSSSRPSTTRYTSKAQDDQRLGCSCRSEQVPTTTSDSWACSAKRQVHTESAASFTPSSSTHLLSPVVAPISRTQEAQRPEAAGMGPRMGMLVPSSSSSSASSSNTATTPSTAPAPSAPSAPSTPSELFTSATADSSTCIASLSPASAFASPPTLCCFSTAARSTSPNSLWSDSITTRFFESG